MFRKIINCIFGNSPQNNKITDVQSHKKYKQIKRNHEINNQIKYIVKIKNRHLKLKKLNEKYVRYNQIRRLVDNASI